MTEEEHHTTHKALAADLLASIGRIRQDVEARSDPVLSEVVNALELVVEITTHAHDHALQNRQRIEALEAASDDDLPF